METTGYRVAIVGAGPTGFYAADELLKATQLNVQVDMFERLPAPYGLVRYGVAPDHLKIKNVTAIFDKVADSQRFRFFGNVAIGSTLTLEQLRKHYHAVILTTGASSDRRLGLDNEDAFGSHPATAFVGWYNGHPDFRNAKFNLDCRRAVVVGVGNVAIDVARILVSSYDELKQSDIAEHALEALAKSKIEEVVIVGRRGPVQAAFTNPELKELEELSEADFWAQPDEVKLDEYSAAFLAKEPDKAVTKRLEMLERAAQRNGQRTKQKLLSLRFCWSPSQLSVDAQGTLSGVRLQKNSLTETLQARGLDEYEDLSAGLLLRSVGYRGVAVEDVPFDSKSATIANQQGRVMADGQHQVGHYTAGWIKRGPSGVIGTNKPCAKETVACLLEDLQAGRHLHPVSADISEILAHHPVVDFPRWKGIDQLEKKRGEAVGRPRVKLTSVEEMLAALDQTALA
jgi:ferredoxin--NADP+ reductase